MNNQIAQKAIGSASESVKRRNPALFGGVKADTLPATAETLSETGRTPETACRQTTDEAKLNKTERAFLEYLRGPMSPCQGQWIGVQSITLKLAHDCRYTPDFMTVGFAYTFWEVKGWWRDDARVKIKVAARLFPWATFIAVKKTKSGWEKEIIKP